MIGLVVAMGTCVMTQCLNQHKTFIINQVVGIRMSTTVSCAIAHKLLQMRSHQV